MSETKSKSIKSLTDIKSHNTSRTFFIFFLALVGIVSFFIIKPYLAFIILSFILAYMFRPLYVKLNSKINKSLLSATIILILGMLVFILPAFFLVYKLASQASNVFSFLGSVSINTIFDNIVSYLGINIDFGSLLRESIIQFRDFLSSSAISILSSLTTILLRLFIMCFLFFYLVKDGDKFINYLKSISPLKKKQTDVLFKETRNVISAVLYGQLLSALVQGFVGGIGFFIFGISNPVFWGFFMGLLSLLPFIGSAFIWVPVSIFLVLQEQYFAGIGLFLYCAIIVSNIDNLIKPSIIGSKANIHPTIILLGVFGGLQLFGFIGLIIGPLILSILMVLIKFYHEEHN